MSNKKAKIHYMAAIDIINRKPLTPTEIVDFVAKEYDYTVDMLVNSGRIRAMAQVRSVCYVILRDLTTLTLKEVAKIFKKDHTTVIHGIKSHYNDFQTNEIYRQKFEEVSFLVKLKTPKIC